jgi:hypothetical protein
MTLEMKVRLTQTKDREIKTRSLRKGRRRAKRERRGGRGGSEFITL